MKKQDKDTNRIIASITSENVKEVARLMKVFFEKYKGSYRRERGKVTLYSNNDKVSFEKLEGAPSDGNWLGAEIGTITQQETGGMFITINDVVKQYIIPVDGTMSIIVEENELYLFNTKTGVASKFNVPDKKLITEIKIRASINLNEMGISEEDAQKLIDDTREIILKQKNVKCINIENIVKQ